MHLVADKMKFDQHLCSVLWLSFAAAVVIVVGGTNDLNSESRVSADGCHDPSVVILNTLNNIFGKTFAPQNISIGITINYKILSLEAYLLVDDVLRQFLITRRSPLPKVIDEHLIIGGVAANMNVQVVFVERVDQILLLHKANARWQTAFLIVLLSVVKSKSKRLELMSQIFAFFMHRHYNINVNILMAGIDDDDRNTCMTELYTFFPYTRMKCESSAPVLLWRYNGSTDPVITFEQFFPEKLSNLHGCPLRVIVWDVPPYVELYGTATNVTQIRGLDATILKTVAKKLNFTLELLPNEPPTLLGGDAFMNGSMSGAYKIIHERRANITLGCSRCTPARTTYLTSTLPYYQMQYIIVLKTSTRYSAYEIMLFPFDIWIWLLVALLAMLRLFHRSYCGSDYGRVVRLLQGSWLVLFFVLRSSYECSIFEFVHNAPIKPMPRTYDELIAQRYKIITDQATYRMTQTLPRLRAITSVVPGQPMDVFNALDSQSTLTGAFTSKTFLSYYLTKHRQKRANFIILRDPIVDNMICMHFPRDSYMVGIVNRQLLHMRSFGLFQQFSKHFDYSNLPPTTATFQRGNTLIQHKDIFVYESMRFIIAASNCLLAAYAFAIIVFALEHISRRLTRLPHLPVSL